MSVHRGGIGGVNSLDGIEGMSLITGWSAEDAAAEVAEGLGRTGGEGLTHGPKGQEAIERVRMAKEAADSSMDRVVVTHQRTVQRSMEEYKKKLQKRLLEDEIRRRRDQDLDLLGKAIAERINHRNLLEAKRRGWSKTRSHPKPA